MMQLILFTAPFMFSCQILYSLVYFVLRFVVFPQKSFIYSHETKT